MDLSYDGVAVSHSCGRSFEVMSGKFPDCRTVYTLAIGVAEKGFSDILKAEQLMRSTLKKLRKCGIYIRHWRMDHPKRAGQWNEMKVLKKENSHFLSPEIRNQKNCGSYYSCDFCYRRATHHQPQVDKGDKRKKEKGKVMVYPAGVEEVHLRSHARHLELADRAHEEDQLHDFYGIKPGRPFITKIFPHMDIVGDVVLDYMHLVCEGKIERPN